MRQCVYRGTTVRRIAAGLIAVAVAVPGGSATAQAAVLPVVEMARGNEVPGCVTPRRLMAFLERRNRHVAPRFMKLAALYRRHGEALGVRWDVAFFQMMVETAGLTFRRIDGARGDVRADDNNFAGLGAVGDGKPGEVFETISDGVRAHLEHVLHYAGRTIADPVARRTRNVQRWGVLRPWHRQFHRPITYSDLAMRWAPDNIAYLETIIRLAQQYQRLYCRGREVIAGGPLPRAPQIASTGWSFALPEARSDGRAQAPHGKPRLDESRSTLGGSALRVAPAAPRRTVPFAVASLVPLPTPRRGAARRVTPVAHRPITRTPRHARSINAPERAKAAAVPPISPQAQLEQRIRDLVSGQKVLLQTSIGATIPIIFEADGTMRGDAGSLAYFLGAARDDGKWWVEKGRLCQRWQVWLDGDPHCIVLEKRKGIIHWRSVGGSQSGTARIVRR